MTRRGGCPARIVHAAVRNALARYTPEQILREPLARAAAAWLDPHDRANAQLILTLLEASHA